MRLVIMESPYSGDVEANVRYARECLADCLSRGESPIASHLLYTQVLNDADPWQRTLGMAAGLEWLRVADAMVVYQDHGISDGMGRAIGLADRLGKEVEYRRLRTVEKLEP